MTRGMHAGPRGATHQSALPGLKWTIPCLAVLCVLFLPVAVAGDDGDWVSVVSSNTITEGPDPVTHGFHDVPDPMTSLIIDDGDPFDYRLDSVGYCNQVGDGGDACSISYFESCPTECSICCYGMTSAWFMPLLRLI